jgi:hypothetical protein
LVISASVEIRVTRSALFIAASLPSQKYRARHRRASPHDGARQGSTHGMLHDVCGWLSQASVFGVPRVLRDIYAGPMRDCQPFFRERTHVSAC